MSRLAPHRASWLGLGMVAILATLARAQPPMPVAPPDQQPAAPSPGQEPTAPTVAAPKLPAPDADALARYVPGAKLAILFEFPGLDAHADAWNETAAAKILSETKTGAMFDEILTQLHAQIVAATGTSKVTSAEEVAMLRHLLSRGVILGVTSDRSNPSASGAVIVLRDAFTPGVKEMFARQVLDQMQDGVKPEVLDKPGGRRVAVTPLKSSGQPVAWWVEDRRDIVVVAPPSHVDAVLDALAGKVPDATSMARRRSLAAADGERRPLAWGFIEFAEAPPWPEEAARFGFDAIQAIQFRWGSDGKAIRTELDVEVPAPRRGLLSLVEQPTFGPSALPPIPEGVEGVSVVSIDPNETLTRLRDVMTELGVANAVDALEGVESAFKQSTRLELRRDVLAHLGPKAVIYAFPQKKGGLAALNSLNPLAAFQLPRMAILVDVKDTKAFNKSITQLMTFANKQLAKLETPGGAGGTAPGPAAGSPPTAGGRGDGAAAAKKGSGFEFKMTSTKPLMYQLNMPAQFAAILNAKPTVALGAKHLVIATAPELAADAVKAEEESDATWTPGPEFAAALKGLSGELVYLQLADPRETMPKAIAELPAAINKAAAALAASRAMAAQAAGTTATGPPPIVQVVIAPEKVPSAREIRDHLFPGSSAFSVDAAGFHLVMRDAFFDITSITAVLNGLSQAPSGSLGPLPFGQPPGGMPGEVVPSAPTGTPPGVIGGAPAAPAGGRRGGLGPEVAAPPPGGAPAAPAGGRRGGLGPEVAAPPPGGAPAAPAGGRRGGLGPEAVPPPSGGGRPSPPG